MKFKKQIFKNLHVFLIILEIMSKMPINVPKGLLGLGVIMCSFGKTGGFYRVENYRVAGHIAEGKKRKGTFGEHFIGKFLGGEI